MGDNKNLVFEESTLSRKVIKEIFSRNARGKMELEHVCKQLDRGKEECREDFNKAKSGLLLRSLRRSALCDGSLDECRSEEREMAGAAVERKMSEAQAHSSWDTTSLRSHDISESSYSSKRGSNLRRSASFTENRVETEHSQSLPRKGKSRRNTVCPRPHCAPDINVRPEIKPEEQRKSRSLSEILPPVTLPPIYLQGLQDKRAEKRTDKKMANEDGLHTKAPGKKIHQRLIRASSSDLTKDLADCRYLRGNVYR